MPYVKTPSCQCWRGKTYLWLYDVPFWPFILALLKRSWGERSDGSVKLLMYLINAEFFLARLWSIYRTCCHGVQSEIVFSIVRKFCRRAHSKELCLWENWTSLVESDIVYETDPGHRGYMIYSVSQDAIHHYCVWEGPYISIQNTCF